MPRLLKPWLGWGGPLLAGINVAISASGLVLAEFFGFTSRRLRDPTSCAMAAASGSFSGFEGRDAAALELEVRSQSSPGTPRAGAVLPAASADRLQFSDNLETVGIVFDLPTEWVQGLAAAFDESPQGIDVGVPPPLDRGRVAGGCL